MPILSIETEQAVGKKKICLSESLSYLTNSTYKGDVAGFRFVPSCSLSVMTLLPPEMYNVASEVAEGVHAKDTTRFNE